MLDNVDKAGRLLPREKLDIDLQIRMGLKVWESFPKSQYFIEKLRVEQNLEVCRISIEFKQEEREENTSGR